MTVPQGFEYQTCVISAAGKNERTAEEHETASEAPAKELDLAKKFVEAIAAPFEPGEFTDRYREQTGSADCVEANDGVV